MKGILFILSGIWFLVFFYFFVRSGENTKYLKIYGSLAYLGLVAIIILITLLLEPVLKDFPTLLPYFVDFFIFLIAAQFLLKPGFKKEE